MSIDFVTGIPQELHIYWSRFLREKDLAQLALTCKFFYTVRGALFKEFYQKIFGPRESYPFKNDSDWEQAAGKHMHCLQLLNQKKFYAAFCRAIYKNLDVTFDLMIEKYELPITKGHVAARKGMSLLHFAAYEGRDTMIQSIIKKNAHINDLNEEGENPLHLACLNGFFDTAKILIDNRANINQQSSWGATPMHFAATSGDEALLLLLIIHKANYTAQDVTGNTPMHYAAFHNRLEAVQLLKKFTQQWPLTIYDESPLHLACLNGAQEVVAYFLKEGHSTEQMTRSGETCLSFAVRSGNLAIVEYLVKHGGKLNTRNQFNESLLCCAIDSGYLNILEYLTEQGLNLFETDQQKSTLMHRAARQSKVEIVLYLIEKGLKIDAQTIYGTTPLHLACRHNHIKMVKTLIDHGANPDMKNKIEFDAFSCALAGNNYEILCYFYRRMNMPIPNIESLNILIASTKKREQLFLQGQKNKISSFKD